MSLSLEGEALLKTWQARPWHALSLRQAVALVALELAQDTSEGYTAARVVSEMHRRGVPVTGWAIPRTWWDTIAGLLDAEGGRQTSELIASPISGRPLRSWSSIPWGPLSPWWD